MISCAARELEMEQPIWNITRGMIRSTAGGAPRARIKAGEARKLLPIIQHILEHYLPHDSSHDVLRLQCIQALSRVYHEVDNWGEGSGDRIGHHCRQFLALYCRLRDTALSDVFWKLYPKFHIFIHCCENNVCPRHTWNYTDESEIGLAAKTAEKLHPRNVSTEVIRKRRLAVYVSR